MFINNLVERGILVNKGDNLIYTQTMGFFKMVWPKQQVLKILSRNHFTPHHTNKINTAVCNELSESRN